MDKLSVLYLSLINKASNKIATARNIGKEEGLAEGKHEKAVETAKNLLAIGLSIEQIAKATDLRKLMKYTHLLNNIKKIYSKKFLLQNFTVIMFYY